MRAEEKKRKTSIWINVQSITGFLYLAASIRVLWLEFVIVNIYFCYFFLSEFKQLTKSYHVSVSEDTRGFKSMWI